MNKIKIMVSSTVTDLLSERNAIVTELEQIPFIELVGAQPINNASVASNSFAHTTGLAKNCDLFILILGKKFGWETLSGKSATEVEFDQAYKHDPTKVLIFQKEFPNIPSVKSPEIDNEKQFNFTERVTGYNSGYWRTTFKNEEELKSLVKDSFYSWLIDRSNTGRELTYIDHFIRLANKFKPEPESQLNYSITPTDVELEYSYFNKPIVIHITKKSIYEGFWDQVSKLQNELLTITN